MQFFSDCFIKSKTGLLRNVKFIFSYNKIIFISILISFSLSYCSDDKEVELDRLAKTYVDLLVVEDFYEGSDSLEIKKAEVYKKYNLDTATYNASFKRINYDQEKWNEFFKLANTYLDSLKAKNRH